MKILIVSQNHRYSNPTAISSSFKRSLESFGHYCEIYDLSYYINRYINYFVKKSTPIRTKFLLNINQKLLEYLSANRFDAILVVKGTFILPETVKEIACKTWISCFNPDDPFNSETWEGSSQSNIPDSIENYSHYFIWSQKLRDTIAKKYRVPTSYLPFAIDPELIKVFKGINKNHQISFIGNGDKERQEWLNKSGEKLSAISGDQIKVFGRYWKPHKGVDVMSGKFGDEYFKVFYESKININILRQQNKGATNMRTFEIPATGNFMLHEISAEAIDFYPADQSAVYFESAEELKDKCLFYLKNEKLRDQIARSAFLLSQNESYTYKGRMRNFLTVVNKEAF